MDQTTLTFFTERLDRIDNKLDEIKKDASGDRERLSVLETQIAPLVADATFKRRLQLAASAGSGAIASGLVIGFRYLLGHKS